MSHIYVTDTGTIVKEEYTVHSLYLNSRGKYTWWACAK